MARDAYDDYESFRRAGSAGDYARAHGLDQLPWALRMMEHPAYDAFWQGQALDKLVAQRPSQVPTMWVQGLWDQEDMWGAIHCYLALKAKGQADHNYLVMGPWRHSQVNYDGYNLGPLKWDGDTALQFRRDVLKPFFDQYLKTGAPKAETPPVLIYNTGENHWDRLKSWPLACETGCAAPLKPLYLQAAFGLGFDKPSGAGAASDVYVSDPAKPVPYIPRPVRFSDSARWQQWLVTDQRTVADRTDVLTYQTPVLTAPVRIGGAPVADLFASTTRHGLRLGGEADRRVSRTRSPASRRWAAINWRCRWTSSAAATARASNTRRPSRPASRSATVSCFPPPTTCSCRVTGSWCRSSRAGSRSTIATRRPTSPNIFFAKPADYVKATQSVFRSAAQPSAVWLPVTP